MIKMSVFFKIDFSLRRRVARTSFSIKKSLNGRVNIECMVEPSIFKAAIAVGATIRMLFLECFFRYLIKVDLPVPA